MKYLALIRGVNVGGNGLVKMAELKVTLETAGFNNIQTYIQSGNVFFETGPTDQIALADHISRIIFEHFAVSASVVVFTRKEWERIITRAPTWWGKDDNCKHNLLILLPPYDMPEVVAAIGELKPDIEAMEPGEGVLYQSMSRKLFGHTTTSKLLNTPRYKRVTVRNYNTATKLLTLF